MPPTTEPIPAPKGNGADAAAFLLHHGYPATIPSIRSSDYELALANPFLYYLTRRLSLARAFDWSEALSRGSWLHRCLELDTFQGPVPPDLLTPLILRRQEELRTICASLGIVGDELRTILDREREDALTTLAWYSAASTVSISPTTKDFRSYLGASRWRVLGRELRATYHTSLWPRTPLIGVFDLFLYNSSTNTLWILDLKSCSESPITRLSTCPLEFQTEHYLYIAVHLLEEGILHKQFDLPTDVTVGGMLHLAIQKPAIKFGQEDRPYTEVPFTPSRGKNKGITRMEREYSGEPSWDLYRRRCTTWYQGVDQYAHLKEERTSSEIGPPVNISYTSVSALDSNAFERYSRRVEFLYDLATRHAVPCAFLQSASDLRQFGGLSKWAPFSLCPVKDWPEIIAREGFIVRSRDEAPLESPRVENPHL